MQKDRLNIYLDPDISAAVRALAGNEELKISRVAEELITLGLSIKKGEVVEQQSLPIIHDIVEAALRKALAQQRADIQQDMQLEFTNEIKSLHRVSDNRFAALLVRAQRDSNIARRLIYAHLARAYGPDYARLTYEDAKEKAGKEMARRDEVDG